MSEETARVGRFISLLRSSDTGRNVRVSVDADTADQLAEQFELAAEMLRKERSADIRL